MALRVGIDTTPLESMANEVSKAVTRAGVVAVNKAILTVRDEVVRQLKGTVSLSDSELKRRIKVVLASESDPEATLYFFGGRVPLAKFNPRRTVVQTRRGRRFGVTVDEGDGRKLIPGAFMGSGRTSGSARVFRRQGNSRLPISQLYSNKLAQAAKLTGSTTDRFQRLAEDTASIEFVREFQKISERELNRE